MKTKERCGKAANKAGMYMKTNVLNPNCLYLIENKIS